MRHGINSEKTDFARVQNNINICRVANEINGRIAQFNTLGFLSCAEVVGGKKEHGTVFPDCVSRGAPCSPSRQHTCLCGRIHPT